MSGAPTDPAAAAALAAVLKEAAYYVKTEQIFFSAMYAVCLWDWLVSLKREWHLIWKSKWSVIKVLYLLCRYWVLFAVPYVLWVYVEDHSLETCLKIFRSPPALAMWNQLWAEGVLLVRTYAFLGNKVYILIPLVLAICTVAAYQLYVDITKMALLPFLDPAGGPCFPTVTYTGSPHIMAFFLAPLLFDTIVTCLTLWRALELRRQSGSAGSPLLKTFVSEGIWYFFLMSAANLANAIFYWQPKAVMSALLIPLSIMFPDILACRMILGLRERGVRHTSGVNHRSGGGGSYSHSSRKLPIKPSQLSAAVKNTGAITDMGFNHELTTFQRDVKSVPFDQDPEAGRGIKVDIESHRYYENSDGDEVLDSKGQSFMP